MTLPSDLSGRELVAALCRKWGHRIHQVGSHVNLETDQPSHQRIVVPHHKSLRIGTLNKILREVAEHKGVSREDILATIRGR
ncbi:MAG TPA: type II toxin-antitoxin system HicA family toxin [Bryobacteraceae bacterium]|nr:type II toxin-antitoxin system HicA family toxin [Bryobacteraceae bacterium]